MKYNRCMVVFPMLFSLFPSAFALTYTPAMIADIRTGEGSSTPVFLAAMGTTVFFTAIDEAHGAELWKTDGTPAGTALVKDIRAGAEFGGPTLSTVAGNILYFRADDGIHGDELWKSDGTEEGTLLVRDINPEDGAGSFPEHLTVLGGTLFFTADNGTDGVELWKTDGTEDGTVMVKDIHAGSESSTPTELTAVGTTLFFQATDQPNNHELWKSDGTEAGTVPVKDINPGTDVSSSPDNLTEYCGLLYFSADDGANGGELWTSDGTEGGTVMVANIATGAAESSDPYDLRVMNGSLYFFAFDDALSYGLWKSNGTEATTTLVKDIEGTDYADLLTVAGSMLFFRASDGVHGYELWKSNGTEAGTVMVKDINPAATGDNGSYPASITAMGSTVFFSADDGTTGTELWKSNGTTTGTFLVKDINPGTGSSSPEWLLAAGEALYLNADDGVHGVELWGFVPDNTAPTGTIVINNNRSATNNPNVTLALTWSDGTGSGTTRMRFSNDGATWSAWEPLTATKSYTLPSGDGHKTVRVQYRDAANNISSVFSDYIRLDTTIPTGSIVINGGAASTTNPLVTLTLTWGDGAGAGVSRMRFSDDGAHWTPWEPPQSPVQHVLPLPPGGYQTVRVQFRDGADNVSVRYSDYIRLVAP